MVNNPPPIYVPPVIGGYVGGEVLVGPVGGASVSIDLFLDGGFLAPGSGTTGTDGTLTFTLKNASSGIYTTTVTDVTAAGLTWDGSTPANEFCK